MRTLVLIFGCVVLALMLAAEPDRVVLRGEDAVPVLAPEKRRPSPPPSVSEDQMVGVSVPCTETGEYLPRGTVSSHGCTVAMPVSRAKAYLGVSQ